MNKSRTIESRNPFLSQLRKEYYQCKKQFQIYNLAGRENGIKCNKKQRQEKTRSKSKRKKQINCSPSRKSARITKCQQSFSHLLQIDKQPIWHAKRRKSSSKYLKIANQIVTKQIPETYKIKSSDPLYEFYSQYQSQEFKQKEQQIQEKQNGHYQNNSQQNNQKNEKQNEKQDLLKQNKVVDSEDTEMKKILAELAQSQIDEGELGDWKPNKMESSMLAIQKLVDEYFIFRMTMRGSQIVKLCDIVKYIRDVNGYYFNQNVLTSMLNINPKLYKLINLQHQKFLKCGKLSPKCVERRQLSTKMKMKRKQSNQQLINI